MMVNENFADLIVWLIKVVPSKTRKRNENFPTFENFADSADSFGSTDPRNLC